MISLCRLLDVLHKHEATLKLYLSHISYRCTRSTAMDQSVRPATALNRFLLYASTRVRFHIVLRHSHHLSIVPVMPPSFPSALRHHRLFILCTVHYCLSSSLRLLSFVLFLRYGSIPPLSCSEHHFSDLWLHYLTLTFSHSCGWTISLLSS